MKHEPRLLRLETYPYRLELQTRFGDLDVNAHLNNVALARCIEELRVRFQRALIHRSALPREERRAFRVVVARVVIDYLAEGRYPDALLCGAGIVRIGNTSYEIASVMTQGERTLALNQTVMVNTGASGPKPVDDRLRAAMQPYLMEL